jgi:ferredoxin
MKRLHVTVDRLLCQGHSVCIEEAPEVFRVNDSETHYPKVDVILEYPPEELREKVMAAAQYCPNRVITVEEIDN